MKTITNIISQNNNEDWEVSASDSSLFRCSKVSHWRFLGCKWNRRIILFRNFVNLLLYLSLSRFVVCKNEETSTRDLYIIALSAQDTKSLINSFMVSVHSDTKSKRSASTICKICGHCESPTQIWVSYGSWWHHRTCMALSTSLKMHVMFTKVPNLSQNWIYRRVSLERYHPFLDK